MLLRGFSEGSTIIFAARLIILLGLSVRRHTTGKGYNVTCCEGGSKKSSTVGVWISNCWALIHCVLLYEVHIAVSTVKNLHFFFLEMSRLFLECELIVNCRSPLSNKVPQKYPAYRSYPLHSCMIANKRGQSCSIPRSIYSITDPV